jgi:DNA-binding XRE family transcriptional regulator
MDTGCFQYQGASGALLAVPLHARSFGDCLRRLRRASRESLACAANEVGVSKSYLCDVENNRCVPGLKVARNLAQHYGLSLDVLSGFLD